MALVGAGVVPPRLVSVKLPKVPVPNTTVSASGAPAAPLLIQMGARRMRAFVLLLYTRRPVAGMVVPVGGGSVALTQPTVPMPAARTKRVRVSIAAHRFCWVLSTFICVS